MVHSRLILAGLAGALSLAAACSATSRSNVFDDESETNAGAGGDGGSGGSTGSFSSGEGGLNLTGGVGGGTGSTCDHPLNADGDGDGFSAADGDCNDCDVNVNPGAIEVLNDVPFEDGGVPEPADEDCDGVVDNVAPPCDTGLALTDPDPMHAAWAVGLCQLATPTKWGVMEAKYVRADGSLAAASKATGIQPGFGPNVNPQEGERMLALSSGNSRIPGQPDECGYNSCSNAGAGVPPPNFPADVPGCSGSPDINDDAALQVQLLSPKNATGYSFNFDFYSFEYPEWVCTSFNDQFIAFVSPPPMGSIDGNISFDSQNNPVSVNIAFFNVCSGCALGTGELTGTGFDTWNDSGATSWLKTTAPITGGEIVTIRFAIWDTGDTAYDSTVLVDNFQWIANGGTVTTGTVSQPDPK